QLLARGDQVWIYDLKADDHRLRLLLEEHELTQATFIQGDVTDVDGLKRALVLHAISHVVHLAGLQVPVCRADPLLGARVNVLGTLAVFEAVRHSKDRVKRLVYASSAAVFGPPSSYAAGSQTDDAPLRPSTHYGVFKCCNEGNARIYYQDFGLSSVGLRPWTIYGVGRDFGMTSEPTKAIKSLALGRPYRISYGGSQDMQWVDDVARIFIRCLEGPYEGAHSYNIRGSIVAMPDFFQALATTDPKATQLIQYGTRQLDIAYDLDDCALEAAFGPLPRTPLDQGVKQTYDHFRRLRDLGRLDTSDLDA
ncbi:MAG TPA: SDR family oxidoreductase, partial [Gemmataceae bacterium]|nr:SDR family oxidoreductase [Gemmataceae bacterium]